MRWSYGRKKLYGFDTFLKDYTTLVTFDAHESTESQAQVRNFLRSWSLIFETRGWFSRKKLRGQNYVCYRDHGIYPRARIPGLPPPPTRSFQAFSGSNKSYKCMI